MRIGILGIGHIGGRRTGRFVRVGPATAISNFCGPDAHRD